VQVSIVMPCLNEAAALPGCIAAACGFLTRHNLDGEIIVVDNGSSDGSAEIAESAGIHLLLEPIRGYGCACRRGLAAAQGDYIVMFDADGTYDVEDAVGILGALRVGADLVLGSRLRGNIDPMAMPWLNRYVGVPILTLLLRQVSKCRVSDAHCGIRGIRGAVLSTLSFRTTGMEFASEMLFEAARHNMVITEIPVSYRGRVGSSKLRPLSDGWRHLKLILSYAIGARLSPSISKMCGLSENIFQ
jgi:glycosyltransferase involved in cell wall biosynthesis